MKPTILVLSSDIQRNIDLDVLRGVAVILILILHVGVLTPGIAQAPFLYHIITRSAVGMQLFFVLSGYLISQSWDKAQNHPHQLRNFACLRIAKILPLYVIMLHINIVVYLWQSSQAGFEPLPNSITEENFNLSNYAAHLVFLQGLIPSWQHSLLDGSWSIVVEVYFYATAPFLLSRCLTTSIATLWWLCLAITVSVLFARLTVAATGAWGYYGFPAQLPCFLFGVLVHRVRQEWRTVAIDSRASPILVLCVLLALGMYRGATSPVGLHMIYAVLFSIVLFVIVTWSKSSAKIAGARILAATGRMSYAIFFAHLFVLKLAHPYVRSNYTSSEWPQALAFNAVIAVLGTWVLSRWFLHPIDNACVAMARKRLYRKSV